MWIRVQATFKCSSCTKRSPLNAAVRALSCAHCGAGVRLTESLWEGALQEAQWAAADLAPNAAAIADYDHRGVGLRLELVRTSPCCPHCEEGLSPNGTASFDCPGCGDSIHLRPSPVKVEGVGLLLGEDRAMLEGRRAKRRVVNLSCTTCGAPLKADGSSRKLACAACTVEQVLSDEVWRRIHAPTRVSPWFIQIEGEGSENPLEDVSVFSMAAGGPRRLYVVGSHGRLDWCVMALDLDPLRLAWVQPIEDHGGTSISVAWDGRVGLYSQDPKPKITWLDPGTGEVVGHTQAPIRLLSMLPMADGTFLGHNHPTQELARFDVNGEKLRTWPPRGCLGTLMDLFGSSGRPHHVGAYEGVGVGWDGDLRVVRTGQVLRLDPEGKVVWKVTVPEISLGSRAISPGAAEDGTTFFGGVGQSGFTTLYRLDPDGKNLVALTDEKTILHGLAIFPNGELWMESYHTNGTDDIREVTNRLRRVTRDGDLLWEHNH